MADNPNATAQNASAPADERYDAQASFAKSEGIASLAREFLPPEEVRELIDHINESWELSKAARSNLVVGPWAKKPTVRGAQSIMLDDFQLTAAGDYWERPGVLGFDSMRSMVEQTPILNGIVLTRIRQVNRFCRPQMGNTDAGFAISHVDPSIELDETQKESIQALQRFMVNCGWESDPRARKRLRRDSFAQFMAKSVRDSLTMDAAPIETEFKRDKKLGIDGFYALDGATIRLCTEHGYRGDDEIFALQVVQGNVRTAYTFDDLIYEVRNPRTDVTASGYGYSETEMLIRVVTYLLNTMTFNGSFFDKNSIPRGILHLAGNFPTSDLAAFKRYWQSMTRGAANAHNLPVLVSKDQESAATFTEVGGQLNEMAFGRWMTFLVSIASAIYGIAPEEISMESFAAGKSALSGSDTEEKLVSSNDKGLRPLLNYYEGVFSDFILQVYGPQYMFRFKGLDAEDAQQRWERQKLTLSWNEMRQIDGMDPVDGDIGDVPMNPSLIPVWQGVTGVGQPQPEEGDFGDEEGAGGDPGPMGEPQPGADPDAEGDEGEDQADSPFGSHGGGDAGGEDEDASPFGKPGGLAKALTGESLGLPVYRVEV